MAKKSKHLRRHTWDQPYRASGDDGDDDDADDDDCDYNDDDDVGAGADCGLISLWTH